MTMLPQDTTADTACLPAVPALKPSLVLPSKVPLPQLPPVEESPVPPFQQLHDEATNQAVLLNWLGQQQVVFHRIYVDVAGGVLPALWLSHVLSQMLVALQQSPDAAGNGEYLVQLDAMVCQTDTGLTPAEQRKCIAILADLGLIVPDRPRAPNTCRLRLQRLTDLMIEHSAPLAAAIRESTGNAPDLDLLEARSRVRRDKYRSRAA